MISYQRLWETMKKKHMSQYKLIHQHQISSGQLARMRKNQHVSTHTIEMFCKILDCTVEEIMEYKKDDEFEQEGSA